jgi:hypothetical protein
MHDAPTPYKLWFHEDTPSHRTGVRFVDEHFSESELKDIIRWLKSRDLDFWCEQFQLVD